MESHDAEENQPHRCGIMSLPPEILSRVFGLLCAETNEGLSRHKTDQLIEQLSSISVAFRSVVLNTATFWTKIDEKYCLRDDFKECIARSKSAPLTVSITLTESTGKWEKLLVSSLSSKDRWKYLHIRIRPGIRIVLGTFPNIESPCLEILEVLALPDDDYDTFFAGWRFPRLKSLTMTNATPPPGICGGLTTFQLRSSYLGFDLTDTFFTELLDCLHHASSLQQLTLDMTYASEPSSSIHFPIVELPEVTNLSIYRYVDFGYLDIMPSTDAFGRLLRAFRVPKVKYFRLAVGFLFDAEITDWVSSFAETPEVLRRVTSLNISAHFAFDEIMMGSFLALVHNVRDLELEVHEIALAFLCSSSELKLDRLRTLTLPKAVVNLCEKQLDLLHRFTSNLEQVKLSVAETPDYNSDDSDNAEQD